MLCGVLAEAPPQPAAPMPSPTSSAPTMTLAQRTDIGASGDAVAQVERPDRLRRVVRSIEEAAVDALVTWSITLVCPLDAELTMGQRGAGHLDSPEALASALGEQEEIEVDLGAEHLVHAAHEAAARSHVLIGVEVLAAHLEAARRIDQLVAEGAALAAFACAALLGLGLPGHGVQSRHRRGWHGHSGPAATLALSTLDLLGRDDSGAELRGDLRGRERRRVVEALA